MEEKKAAERIAKLRATILAHNEAYYVNNAPVISDFEYDLLVQELQTLEKMFPALKTPDSPTQKVGSDLSSPETAPGFERLPHAYPMLSLSNTYDAESLRDFDERIRKTAQNPFSYNCELKFDGTAICLTYQNGLLVKALTRGDGTLGDNVIENVRQIPSIPRRVSGNYPPEFEIRGEILLPFANFNRLNRERETNEEPLFANPRNAAAGTLKLLDPQEVRRRGLDCYLYHLIADPMPAATHTRCMAMARSWGLKISEYTQECSSLDQVYDFLRYWEEERHRLPFATDGVVIKVNQLDLQRRLGMTAKSPRWATAYKFQAEQAETVLRSVSYQVGRTGAVTPVANLDPVLLSGTIVKRASLHNAEQIALLDLRTGDSVYVEKGGEIIPKVVGLNHKKRPAESRPIRFIDRCPQCGTPLVKDPDEAKHYCPNRWNCPPQVKGRILHFMSRKAMNILGGDALIDRLYEMRLVYDAADLYSLRAADFASMDNWGEKSTRNFLRSLAASREVPFYKVLYAIGIPMVGETTARYLASHFHSMQEIENAGMDALRGAPEIGELIAGNIVAFFADERNRLMIERLRAAGLQMQETLTPTQSQELDGLKFVISGSFGRSREEMKAFLEEHGAKVLGALSSQVNYILAGEKMGPAKKVKARELGIPVISEQELNALIKNRQNHD